MDPDHEQPPDSADAPRARSGRDELLRRVAERGFRLPRAAVLVGLAWLVTMTVWGFVRSLAG